MFYGCPRDQDEYDPQRYSLNENECDIDIAFPYL